MTFKDYFSSDSKSYSNFRPHYPSALFEYLSSISREHEKAWDCATGTGQSAQNLADYFAEVIATDASQNQISNAVTKVGVQYQVAPAEQTSIEDSSVDLITVAQALHWFDIEKFSQEVNRVLKFEGILAVWTYNLLSITPDIDKLINQLYAEIVEDYWPPERKMVEDRYRGIEFPFQQVLPPSFAMEEVWNFPQLIGYLNTWSAVKSYQQVKHQNPVSLISDQISIAWGKPELLRKVTWPLSNRVWRKSASH